MLIPTISSTLIEELSNCFVSTQWTKSITQLAWPPDDNKKAEMYRSIPEDNSEWWDEIQEPNAEAHIKETEVLLIDLEWLYREKKNFVAFSKMLQELPNSAYGSEFIDCLLENNWEELKKQILLKYFSSYIAYAVTSIAFMKMALDRSVTDDSTGLSAGLILLGVITGLLWLRETYIEIL